MEMDSPRSLRTLKELSYLNWSYIRGGRKEMEMDSIKLLRILMELISYLRKCFKKI